MKNSCSSCNSKGSSGPGSPAFYWSEVRPLFAEYPRPECMFCWFKEAVAFSCIYCPVVSIPSSLKAVFASAHIKEYDDLSVEAKKELQQMIDCGITPSDLGFLIPEADAFAAKSCIDPEMKGKDSGEKIEIYAAIKEVISVGVQESYYLAEVCTPKWNKKSLVHSWKFPLSTSQAKMTNEVTGWVWSHYSKDKYSLNWL